MTEAKLEFNTSWWVGAGRALLLRCPRCGRSPVFRRFFIMNESCATCSLKFDRGHGYWLGAMMFNMAFAFGAVIVAFLLTLWATTPDPNWDAVIVATVAVSIVIPLAFFPYSRTLWIAAERWARLRDGVEVE
jgi:uncharacterized protein (DUF983 family)